MKKQRYREYIVLSQSFYANGRMLSTDYRNPWKRQSPKGARGVHQKGPTFADGTHPRRVNGSNARRTATNACTEPSIPRADDGKDNDNEEDDSDESWRVDRRIDMPGVSVYAFCRTPWEQLSQVGRWEWRRMSKCDL